MALLDAEKKLELPPKEKETRPRLVMKEKEIEIETQRFWVLDVSESVSAGLTQVNNVVAVPVCSDLRVLRFALRLRHESLDPNALASNSRLSCLACLVLAVRFTDLGSTSLRDIATREKGWERQHNTHSNTYSTVPALPEVG